MVVPLFSDAEERLEGRLGLAAALALAEVIHKGLPTAESRAGRIQDALGMADAMIAEAERQLGQPRPTLAPTKP